MSNKKKKAIKMKEQNIVNPIVIHPHLLQKFMKQGKHYSNLLAL